MNMANRWCSLGRSARTGSTRWLPNVRCAGFSGITQAEHDASVRREFARQAVDGYGTEAWYRKMAITGQLEWMLEHLPLVESERCLDVATGTAICARAIAPRVSHVVGLDQTPEMLEAGKRLAEETGLNNISFIEGNALTMPFADDTFDLVLCRLVVHHVHPPSHVSLVQEMTRVCKPGGRVALIDLTAPEDASLATRYNALEQLRDPSHTTALSPTSLQALLTQSGLVPDAPTPPFREFSVNLEGWMDSTHTVASARSEIVAAVEAELNGTGCATGMRPHRAGRDGHALHFVHAWAVAMGHKPSLASL